MHPLAGPRAKLIRAQHHYTSLCRDIYSFIGKNPYKFVIAEREANGDFYALRASVAAPLPIEFGVVIGELAHNLRSALDGLFWQLVIANGVDPTTLRNPRSAFPIFKHGRLPQVRPDNQETWRGKGRRAVRNRVSGANAAIINRLQPFRKRNGQGKTSTLWLLHELNNLDKHQLVPLAAVGTSQKWGHYMFDGPAPVGVTYELVCQHTEFDPTVPFVIGAKVGKVHRLVVDAVAGATIPYMPIVEVIFGHECGEASGLSLMKSLDHMGSHVAQILLGRFRSTFGPCPPEWLTPAPADKSKPR